MEGVFLGGSLATARADECSDVDLGVVAGNTEEECRNVYDLWPSLAQALGEPLVCLERSWENCRMVALLYGRADCPPRGLEVDVIFSRLEHVAEQMPHSPYRVLFDRTGRLADTLARTQTPLGTGEVVDDLRRQMLWFPFYVYDANKGLVRGDSLHVQSLLQQMREAIFFACACRQAAPVYGAKGATAVLSAEERSTVEASYRVEPSQALTMLRGLYFGCLREIPESWGITPDLDRLKAALDALP